MVAVRYSSPTTFDLVLSVRPHQMRDINMLIENIISGHDRAQMMGALC